MPVENFKNACYKIIKVFVYKQHMVKSIRLKKGNNYACKNVLLDLIQ